MKPTSGGAVTHGQVKMLRIAGIPLGVTLKLPNPTPTNADKKAAATVVDKDFGADWLSVSWHRAALKGDAEETVEAHRAKIVAAISQRIAVARELTALGLTSKQVAKAISYAKGAKNKTLWRPEVKAAGFVKRLEPLPYDLDLSTAQVQLPTGGAGGMGGLFSGPAPATARLAGPTMAAPAARSAADRAADVKALLDAGIVSQDAFDAKIAEILRSI